MSPLQEFFAGILRWAAVRFLWRNATAPNSASTTAICLLRDPLSPLIALCRRPLLDDAFGHETTMQRCPAVGKRGSSDAYHWAIVLIIEPER